MNNHLDAEAIVVGGGFFGGEIATLLRARLGGPVILLEKEGGLLQRASYTNQARIHGGYHYPRSLLTARRSRVNHPQFLADYAAAVLPGFTGYYAVSRRDSNVTADQFRLFMERVGAPLRPAPATVKNLFDPDFIEDVWGVEESVFDAAKLKELVERKLAGEVDVRLGTEAQSVRPEGDHLVLTAQDSAGQRNLLTRHVFNVAYSNINGLLRRSRLPVIPLKHELTEMPLVTLPPALDNVGVTVMCGPFFSVMPFPDRRCHSLSHVRYTPHHEWSDDEACQINPHDHLTGYHFKSRLPEMIHDASRYLPALTSCRPTGHSLWEVKTVLPMSESDDSRPILFRRDWGLPGLHCILGAKIDNIYDILAEVKKMEL